VVTLHTRKKERATNPQELIAATQALIGAADASVVLFRPRGIPALYWRGRDIEEHQCSAGFIEKTCSWVVVGEVKAGEKTAERQAIVDTILEAGKPLLAKEVAANLGKNEGTTRNLIARLVPAGRLLKMKGGGYWPVDHELPAPKGEAGEAIGFSVFTSQDEGSGEVGHDDVNPASPIFG
jgi:hypothetical protein